MQKWLASTWPPAAALATVDGGGGGAFRPSTVEPPAERMTTAAGGGNVSSEYPLPFCNDSCTWTAVFVVSSFLSAIAVAINVCVIVVIRRTPEMRRQPYSVLMVNLCASNVLTSLVRGVLSNCGMLTYVSYTLPGCYVADVAYTVTTFVSLTTITVMSFDRFLGIAYHLRYATYITPLKYSAFVLVQWLVCLALGVLPIFKVGIKWCVRRFGGCSYSSGGYVVWIQTVVVYVPCALLILFSYIRIWVVIRRLTQTASTDRKERGRGIRTTLIILTAFVATTLPRLIVALTMYQGAGASGHGLSDEVRDVVEDATSLFLSCNALASPIIYSLTNRTFKDRLTSIASKKYRVSSSPAERSPAPGGVGVTIPIRS